MNKDVLLKKIVELVNEGATPEDIYLRLGISRRSFYRLWSYLKGLGVVEKIGYGVYSVNQTSSSNLFQAIGNESPQSVKANSDDEYPVGTDRAHAFIFTMPFPFTFPLRKQEKFLKNLGFDYKSIGVSGLWRGFSFLMGDWLVKFHPKSLTATLRKGVSFFSSDSHEAYLLAVNDFLEKVVVPLERSTKVSWKRGKEYRFKTSRQHHARIKDSVAKGYRLKKQKLHVRDEEGTLWLLADFSFSADELESVAKDSAVRDYRVVNRFMNSVRDTGVTMQDVLNMFAQSQEQMGYYAENMVSHVKAVQKLGSGVEELTNVVKDLKGGNLKREVDSVDDLMMVVESIDDLEKYRDFVEGLSSDDKLRLTDWISDTFGK